MVFSQSSSTINNHKKRRATEIIQNEVCEMIRIKFQIIVRLFVHLGSTR